MIARVWWRMVILLDIGIDVLMLIQDPLIKSLSSPFCSYTVNQSLSGKVWKSISKDAVHKYLGYLLTSPVTYHFNWAKLTMSGGHLVNETASPLPSTMFCLPVINMLIRFTATNSYLQENILRLLQGPE